MFEINLDSSIIISNLVKDIHSVDVVKAILRLLDTKVHIYISLIAYSEIWTGIELIDNPAEKKEAITDLEQMLESLSVKVLPDNMAIAKRAARAQAEYKKKGGTRDILIPDFLIGANAEFYSKRILTTNPRDFMKYFPEVEVITPPEILKEL